VSVSLVAHRCRTSDRTPGGARGVDALAPLFGKRLGREPREIGTPSRPRVGDWREDLVESRGCLLEAGGQVEDALTGGNAPVLLSAECTIGLTTVPAALRQRPQARVLWLDAHGDFHTWSSTQTQYIGGMPLAMFVGRVDQGPDARSEAARACLSTIGVQPYPQRQIVLADARDLDPGEREALLASRIVRCTLSEVTAQLRPHERIHLHWDTDVIDDPGRMPALKYHVRRGPGAADVTALFRELRSCDVVAVSVSAWHAEQDRDDRTARACLDILNTLLED
jgi:arginase